MTKEEKIKDYYSKKRHRKCNNCRHCKIKGTHGCCVSNYFYQCEITNKYIDDGYGFIQWIKGKVCKYYD